MTVTHVPMPGDPDYEPPPSGIAGFDEIVDATSYVGVKFRFKRLESYTPGASWLLMVYGPSKTGKTFFAGTAGPRTLYINTGDGIETLMAPAFTSKYPDAKKMIMVDVREAEDESTAFDMITDAIDFALEKFPDKFDTVVLDEATAMRKYALNKAMELNTSARTSSSRKNRREEYVKADIGDYGTEMDMIEWFLGEYIPKFKAANKHFLMLAHERQIFQKAAKIGDDPVLRRVLPGFTGKTFPDKVPSFFDDVFHSEVINNANDVASYRLRTVGNAQEMGGVRHGGIFNSAEENPNFLSMLDRIKRSQPAPKGRR